MPCLKDYQLYQEEARNLCARRAAGTAPPPFPPPPEQVLDPEVFIGRLFDAALRTSDFIQHPFCVDLAAGRLNRKQLQFWVQADYAYLVDIVRAHAWKVGSAASLDQMRDELLVLIEELGNELVGGAYPSHPDLWVRFGEGLGLTAQSVREAPIPMGMELVIARARLQRLQLTDSAGTSAGLHDSVMAIVYPVWRDVLERCYGVPSQALAFFRAHGEENWERASRRVTAMARLCVSPEQQATMWRRYAVPVFRARMNAWRLDK